MQLPLPFGARARASRSTPVRHTLLLGRRAVVVTYVRHRQARHYVLCVQEDGSVRVTIPRGGSRAAADRFVREKAAWIERERYRADLRRESERLQDERRVSVHGEEFPVEVVEGPSGPVARFGPFQVALARNARSPRPAIDTLLRRLAAEELPRRLMELANDAGRNVAHVTVRGQRTRWGSCSPSGRISLNWRLVQMPPPVRDYILLHELTHLAHLDHSKRFWRELERVCPWHREARRWLRTKTGDGREAR